MKKILKSAVVFLIILGTSISAYADTNGTIRLPRMSRKKKAFYHIVAAMNKKTEGISIVKASIAAKDKTSPKPTTTNFDFKVTGKNKKGHHILEADFDCNAGKCLFDKDADPIGKTYTITLKLIDSTGTQIGNSESFDVEAKWDNETCNNKTKLENFSMEGFNYYHPNSNLNNTNEAYFSLKRRTECAILSFDYVPSVATGPDGSEYYRDVDNNISASVIMQYTYPNKKGNNTITIPATIDTKTKKFKVECLNLDSVNISSCILNLTTCGTREIIYEVNLNQIRSVEEEAIYFKTKKVKENNSGTTDSTSTCTNNIRIGKTTTATLKTTGGISIVNIAGLTFSDGNKTTTTAITNLTVEANVELLGCDGKAYFITIPMTYSDKTGTYRASKALTKCGTGEYKLQSITFKGKDKCHSTSVWVRNWQYG